MSDYVTRAEFDELAARVDAQSRTDRLLLREIAELKMLTRAIARHLGIDTNGDHR